MLGGRFGYFLVFFSGRGEEGGVRGEREGGGSVFFFENPRRGGGSQERVGGARGPGGCLREFGEIWGGGGLNIFFRGRNARQECQSREKLLTNSQRHWSIRISLKTRQREFAFAATFGTNDLRNCRKSEANVAVQPLQRNFPKLQFRL